MVVKMVKSVSERVKKNRDLKREQGLVKVELWVHKTRKAETKLLEKDLQKPK